MKLLEGDGHVVSSMLIVLLLFCNSKLELEIELHYSQGIVNLSSTYYKFSTVFMHYFHFTDKELQHTEIKSKSQVTVNRAKIGIKEI